MRGLPSPQRRPVYTACSLYQTARVPPFRFAFPALLLLAIAGSGCARLKDEFLGESAAEMRYEADTLLLKSEPPLLFRIVPTDNGGARVFPIAAGTGNGVQMLRLSDRAWREFDQAFFRSGKLLPLIHQGASAGDLRIVRGMWDPPSQPIDSFPGCAIVIPVAIGLYEKDASFEVAIARPGRPGTPRQRANVDEALANVSTLIGPSQGVSVSELAEYRRRAFVVPNMVSQADAVVAIYDDTKEIPPDKRRRPKQLVVVLERSPYGFRPSFIFATRGGPTDEPPWRLLDWGDLTGDGTPELIFGLDLPQARLSTIVVGYSAGEWRELMRRGEGRCDF